MSKVKNILFFVMGFGAGSFAAKYFITKKYTKFLEDQENSRVDESDFYFEKMEKEIKEQYPDLWEHILKTVFNRETDSKDNVDPQDGFIKEEQNKPLKRSGRYPWGEDEVLKNNPEMMKYYDELEKRKYGKTNPPKEKSYVITPEEFGTLDGYDEESLVYYKGDNVLAYESGKSITFKEMEEMVGAESLNHFGEYEDDSVYVRNNINKCDYEILMDLRKYSDVKAILPMEEE